MMSFRMIVPSVIGKSDYQRHRYNVGGREPVGETTLLSCLHSSKPLVDGVIDRSVKELLVSKDHY